MGNLLRSHPSNTACVAKQLQFYSSDPENGDASEPLEPIYHLIVNHHIPAQSTRAPEPWASNVKYNVQI